MYGINDLFNMISRLLFLAALFYSAIASASSVVDYDNNLLEFKRPVKRIITLAPHIVENVYSANAGDRIVGTVSYSDYPEAAKLIPHIGSYNAFSIEKIVSLKPDLVIAWKSGNGGEIITKLKSLGLDVYIDNPKRLEDIARSVNDVAHLAGTYHEIKKNTDKFLERISELRQRNVSEPKKKIFYQVWDDPLQTISGDHIISDVINLCGAENIFADSPMVAPIIGIESLLKKDPHIIIASGLGEIRPNWLETWNAWPSLFAVKHKQLYFIHPDLIQRHTMRIMLGLEEMCTFVGAAKIS